MTQLHVVVGILCLPTDWFADLPQLQCAAAGGAGGVSFVTLYTVLRLVFLRHTT